MATTYARSVLDVVARIPRGRVMTNGDVAKYLGSGSARTVGMVLARHGHEVPCSSKQLEGPAAAVTAGVSASRRWMSSS